MCCERELPGLKKRKEPGPGKKTPGGAGTHTGQTHEPHKPNPLKTNPPTDSRAPDHTQTAPVHTQTPGRTRRHKPHHTPHQARWW